MQNTRLGKAITFRRYGDKYEGTVVTCFVWRECGRLDVWALSVAVSLSGCKGIAQMQPSDDVQVSFLLLDSTTASHPLQHAHTFDPLVHCHFALQKCPITDYPSASCSRHGTRSPCINFARIAVTRTGMCPTGYQVKVSLCTLQCTSNRPKFDDHRPKTYHYGAFCICRHNFWREWLFPSQAFSTPLNITTQHLYQGLRGTKALWPRSRLQLQMGFKSDAIPYIRFCPPHSWCLIKSPYLLLVLCLSSLWYERVFCLSKFNSISIACTG